MLEKVDFDQNRIWWFCGVCDHKNDAFLAELTVGGREDETDDPRGCENVMYLPRCVACAANGKWTEQVLSRTTEATDEQLRLVNNAIFKRVQEIGKVHSRSAAVYAQEAAERVVIPALPAEGAVEDLTGRAAKAAAAAAEAAHEAEYQAQLAEMAEAYAAEQAALLAAKRILEAAATINKREGRRPGMQPSLDEINAELAAMEERGQ